MLGNNHASNIFAKVITIKTLFALQNFEFWGLKHICKYTDIVIQSSLNRDTRRVCIDKMEEIVPRDNQYQTDYFRHCKQVKAQILQSCNDIIMGPFKKYTIHKMAFLTPPLPHITFLSKPPLPYVAH